MAMEKARFKPHIATLQGQEQNLIQKHLVELHDSYLKTKGRQAKTTDTEMQTKNEGPRTADYKIRNR